MRNKKEFKGINYISKYKKEVDSIVLIERGNTFLKSTAGLRSFRYLDGGWKVIAALLIFPRFLRDWVYDWIARNRYKWFGKKEECNMPDENVMNRFIL